MFKLSRIRPFSAINRRKPQYFILRPVHHEIPYKVQRVQFRRPPVSWRRASSILIYPILFYTYLFIITPDELLDEVEDEELDEEDLEPIFIPLGWAKPTKRTFYKGSDPEWQEFVKFSKENQRHARIRDQLISQIRSTMANDSRFTARLGSVNISAGKAWLDIVFPDGPPQEYERAGLEVGDDYMKWTRKPVSQTNYKRLERALWPSAAFSSIYAAANYMFQVQVQRARDIFGFEATSSNLQTREFHKRILKKNGGIIAPESTENPNGSKRTAAEAAKLVDGRTPEKGLVLPPSGSLLPQNVMAMSIFTNTLAHKWQLNLEAPRGTIIVTGLIEVQGSKARCTMDVAAAYDPKQDKFVMIKAGMRRVQERQQRPKGGR